MQTNSIHGFFLVFFPLTSTSILQALLLLERLYERKEKRERESGKDEKNMMKEKRAGKQAVVTFIIALVISNA